jgi:hypothetical protein
VTEPDAVAVDLFVSDVLGSGHDWEATSGLPDGVTLVRLRRIQLKLADVIRS